VQSIQFTYRSLQEDLPGPTWAGVFAELWPHYRPWFLRHGEAARPSYADSARMLHAHMPELVPTWERLVELAGGGDLAARMLAMVNPPPYLSGCSQGVWRRAGGPLLVRNYDYAPARLEGIVWRTGWTGRRVMGTSDCLWGLLDGVNEDGLGVSLTFGGRSVLGDGFGVPLIVRYLLETCTTVAEARDVLARLPYHLAHTLTLADAGGDVLTAHLSPDRGVAFRPVPAATNHQDAVEWTEHAAVTGTLEREACILRLLDDRSTTAEAFVAAFLLPPLHSTTYSSGFGTLYTAAYDLAARRVEYRWPGSRWRLELDAFRADTHMEALVEASVA
jgi:predicted choloylglycine hydrolase